MYDLNDAFELLSRRSATTSSSSTRPAFIDREKRGVWVFYRLNGAHSPTSVPCSGSRPVTVARRAAAELLGTAFLVMAVIGSGIAASRLSPDDVGSSCWRTASPPVPRSWP